MGPSKTLIQRQIQWFIAWRDIKQWKWASIADTSIYVSLARNTTTVLPVSAQMTSWAPPHCSIYYVSGSESDKKHTNFLTPCMQQETCFNLKFRNEELCTGRKVISSPPSTQLTIARWEGCYNPFNNNKNITQREWNPSPFEIRTLYMRVFCGA
jgi:hypothetical protein